MAESAGGVDDSATACLAHGGNLMLHRIEDAPDIDVEDLSVLFLGGFIQRGSSFDTGVVKGDIETIVGCQDEINSCPDIGILGEIRFEEGRGTTALLDLGDDFGSFFFAGGRSGRPWRQR
jgi:hypothetical protein